jgi:hypothetical protein
MSLESLSVAADSRTSFNLLLSLILFLPEPVSATILVSSRKRALDPDPEKDDFDNGDRVIESRDDLDGVRWGGGIFSWSLSTSVMFEDGGGGMWLDASIAGLRLRFGRESDVSLFDPDVKSARMVNPIS